jgi:hypothetical protein
MKECPLKVDEDACEQCHWNFGRDQCAPFSMATDLSYRDMERSGNLHNRIKRNDESSIRWKRKFR